MEQDMTFSFERQTDATMTPGNAVQWFVFVGDRLVLIEDGAVRLPTAGELAAADLLPARGELLGELDRVSCFVGEIEGGEISDPFRTLDLRSAFGVLPDAEFAVAGLGSQILHWERTSRFCSRCGTATDRVLHERAMRCPACGLTQYPRVSPAMIVLVHRPGQVLLTRQPSWPAGRYSLFAGFVEPGESLEACVAREVAEEGGVRIEKPRYLGSQPWPFPHQLMIGFHAQYRSGEIVIDRTELEDVRWFDLHDLPQLPPPLSIARRIIEWHLRAQTEPDTPFPPDDPFTL
jgi:NAD+ diphosphatase